MTFDEKQLQDYKLIKRAINGDEEAFSELLKKYYKPLYHTVLKIIKNQEDTEDIVIDTFSKAFENLSTYTPTFAFSTWLFKIGVNNCIDFLRKKKAQIISIYSEIYENKDLKETLKTDDLDPEELIIKDQNLDLIKKTLEVIDPLLKEILFLRYYQELPYKEIAKRMNLPLGTVKSKLFRAKRLIYLITKKKYKDTF